MFHINKNISLTKNDIIKDNIINHLKNEIKLLKLKINNQQQVIKYKKNNSTCWLCCLVPSQCEWTEKCSTCGNIICNYCYEYLFQAAHEAHPHGHCHVCYKYICAHCASVCIACNIFVCNQCGVLKRDTENNCCYISRFKIKSIKKE